MTVPRLPPSKLHALLTAHGETPTFAPVDPVVRKRKYEESENQCAVIKWFDAVSLTQFQAPSFLLHSIPNGSALGVGKEDWQVRQRIIRAKRLLAEGLRPGCCDLFLAVPKILRFDPDPFHPDNADRDTAVWSHGLYLEMKKRDEKKSKVSQEQTAFIAAVSLMGYKVCVCRSDESAIDEITKYLLT